ncbi:chemotaxis protein CheW [Pseudoduganella eburnea]|uniref:Chemotaxis protein CheW n=1 Tax=Massilia eburnea TaxID=1776165 RepID=A0A6L6QQN1_9BURK|nr:chemotaxis protein CheW [Massilia eburnea]MTW14505.1 chemotaxis protein CheW [Massilia eburnea]
MANSTELNGPQAQAANATEVLAFRLGNEEFGIDIQAVRELRGYSAVTQLAEAPAYLKGVINLRGVIVPIVDLRIKLGIGNGVYNEFTVVVVLALSEQQVGIVVDSVSDVLSLTAEQVKAPPGGANFGNAYLTGIATLDQRMLQLADLSQLLSDITAPAKLPMAA